MNFLDPRLPARFWAKCIPEPNSGCWLWFGSHNGRGYGETWLNNRKIYAHRAAYESFIGPIPRGLELDHRRCLTPECCNPLHVEPVTHAVNVRRGNAGKATGARARAASFCKHGHEFTPENTFSTPSRPGRRRCRACGRAAARRNREQRNVWQRARRLRLRQAT